MTMSITSKYKPYKNGFGPYVPDTYKFDYPYTYKMCIRDSNIATVKEKPNHKIHAELC